jgi:hypothetical protein
VTHQRVNPRCQKVGRHTEPMLEPKSSDPTVGHLISGLKLAPPCGTQTCSAWRPRNQCLVVAHMLFFFVFHCVGPACGAFCIWFHMLVHCRAVGFPAQRHHVNFDWSFMKICTDTRSELASPATNSSWTFQNRRIINVDFLVALYMNLLIYARTHFSNAVAVSFPAQHIL